MDFEKILEDDFKKDFIFNVLGSNSDSLQIILCPSKSLILKHSSITYKSTHKIDHQDNRIGTIIPNPMFS